MQVQSHCTEQNTPERQCQHCDWKLRKLCISELLPEQRIAVDSEMTFGFNMWGWANHRA
jgi:hypothetical protein